MSLSLLIVSRRASKSLSMADESVFTFSPGASSVTTATPFASFSMLKKPSGVMDAADDDDSALAAVVVAHPPDADSAARELDPTKPRSVLESMLAQYS